VRWLVLALVVLYGCAIDHSSVTINADTTATVSPDDNGKKGAKK